MPIKSHYSDFKKSATFVSDLPGFQKIAQALTSRPQVQGLYPLPNPNQAICNSAYGFLCKLTAVLYFRFLNFYSQHHLGISYLVGRSSSVTIWISKNL